jgi:hypothetical protein
LSVDARNFRLVDNLRPFGDFRSDEQPHVRGRAAAPFASRRGFQRLLTAGSASIEAISVFSLFTMSAGVPFGTTSPAQVRMSYPLSSASSAEGTFGSIGVGTGDVTNAMVRISTDRNGIGPERNIGLGRSEAEFYKQALE